MPTLHLDDQVLPYSLLPVLHDCYHHHPPLWFAEFEHVYRTFLPSIASRSLSMHVLERDMDARRERDWLFWQWWEDRIIGRRRFRAAESAQEEHYRNQFWGWYILCLVRALFLIHHLTPPSCHNEQLDAPVSEMLALDEAASAAHDKLLAGLPRLGLKSVEVEHFSQHGIAFPPALLPPSPTPPASFSRLASLPLRAPSALRCFNLRALRWGYHQGCRSREGRVTRVGSKDLETEWACSEARRVPKRDVVEV